MVVLVIAMLTGPVLLPCPLSKPASAWDANSCCHKPKSKTPECPKSVCVLIASPVVVPSVSGCDAVPMDTAVLTPAVELAIRIDQTPLLRVTSDILLRIHVLRI